MLKTVILWIFTCGLSLSAQQKVASVQVVAADPLSSGEVVEALGILQNQPLPEDFPHAQHGRLQSLYRQQGYFHAQLDSFRFDAASRLTLWVSAGPAMQLGRVDFYNVSGAMASTIASHWDLGPGTVFRPAQIDNRMQAMTARLAEAGHALARLTIDSLKIHPGKSPRVDLRIAVESGPTVAIASVTVRGQKLTKEAFIRRECRLERGMRFKPSLLRQSVEALNRLGYFHPLSEPDVLFDSEGAHVILTVEERNTYRFDGILGYVPPASERETGYTTGQLEFALQNLFGTGRDFYANWQKKNRHSQQMALRYREPWLFNLPVFASAGFAQEIRDSSYVRRDAEMALGYVARGRWEAGTTLKWVAILPDSAEAVLQRIPKSSTRSLSGFFNYSSMNDPVNPRKGLSLSASISYGLKQHLAFRTAGMKKSEDLREMALDLAYVQPLRGRHVLYLGLHGAEIEADHIDAGHLIRIGGTKTVRGYAEDAFNGHRSVWMNAEYRLLTGPRSRLFLFADGMQMETSDTDGQVVKLIRWGYGFGIRLSTRLGVMGVDYGLGEGDGWMNGKVHVGLINHF